MTKKVSIGEQKAASLPFKKPKKPKKEEKLFQNFLKIVEQFIGGKSFSPATFSELVQKLQIPPKHTEIFEEVLSELVAQGIVRLSRGKYIAQKSQVEVITGVIHMHPRGFGFVRPDDPSTCDQDVFIPRPYTQNAVDGDKVEVTIDTLAFSEKGPEGKVVGIVERGRTHIAGIIKAVYPNGAVYAYVPLLGTSQQVAVQPLEGQPLHVGDRIIMEVIDWGDKRNEAVCRMSHYLGHISDPSCDIPAAIEEYELRADFPSKAVVEAKNFGKIVLKKDLVGREDLRDLECFTIDPDTAKDYDDALSLSQDAQGHFHLGVHIADVSHYVRPGSALDLEASRRGNSTYFPGFCLPMLPHELSSHLCSLRANVKRLTVSVHMHLDPEGNMLDYRISRSVIKSKKRMTYREAKQILDGQKKSRFKPTLQLMVELCYKLKQKRYERGSIEFAMPDLVVQVNERGVPLGLDTIVYDITHQLVEEFMLKANEVIATHLYQEGKNLPYRIHDVPAAENMRDFSLLASAFGFHLSEAPTPAELQKLFDEALDTPYGQYLATAYIRRMRLAIYSSENVGHYGLGLTHYCHFTSPIRRYIDLVIHRLLFGFEVELPYLERIASECSEQERLSAKAEGSVVLLKKYRLLQEIKQQDPYKQYEAVITRVKNFGFFFEVLDFMLEGFLHVSEIGNDYYVYEDSSLSLQGTRTGQAFTSGTKISVILKEIDFITLESQWHFVTSERTVKNSPQTKQKKKGENLIRRKKKLVGKNKPLKSRIKSRLRKRKK
ncbi:VacB/RNase II family 3'-5' exoribonuclease [Parachlamydia sp. AcF125]|uniref:ribonuclease R family protein n=1 Tax=Parachlamydia sp. AcF125 TaxID=2795736 RepID=UPI001BCA3B80|nr:VacB/RNase II family 3'-5' exoribonuclease [Parachlamydia sp. AcF125]MBS4169198.1 Ribonuclease R [Parachlamydia sp. AcF125]